MIAIIFVVGLFFGCLLMTVISRANSIGSLRLDTSDPSDDPCMFLELSKKDMDVIYRKEYIMLKVNTKSFITHK